MGRVVGIAKAYNLDEFRQSLVTSHPMSAIRCLDYQGLQFHLLPSMLLFHLLLVGDIVYLLLQCTDNLYSQILVLTLITQHVTSISKHLNIRIYIIEHRISCSPCKIASDPPLHANDWMFHCWCHICIVVQTLVQFLALGVRIQFYGNYYH